MRSHELADFGFTALEAKYLTKRANRMVLGYDLMFLVVTLVFLLALIIAVSFELTISPTTQLSSDVHQENEWYCAHLADYQMRDGDRAKVESYCKNI